MDDLSRFLAVRAIVCSVISVAAGCLVMYFLGQVYALLSAGTVATLGLLFTYTRLPMLEPDPLPSTMPNGGELEPLLDDEQLREKREQVVREVASGSSEAKTKKEDVETYEIDLAKPINEVAEDIGKRLYTEALLKSKVSQKTELIRGEDGKMQLKTLIIKFVTKPSEQQKQPPPPPFPPRRVRELV